MCQQWICSENPQGVCSSAGEIKLIAAGNEYESFKFATLILKDHQSGEESFEFGFENGDSCG